jgi:hypothetical protein
LNKEAIKKQVFAVLVIRKDEMNERIIEGYTKRQNKNKNVHSIIKHVN